MEAATFDAVHNSTVFVLQNVAGAGAWPATAPFEAELKTAFAQNIPCEHSGAPASAVQVRGHGQQAHRGGREHDHRYSDRDTSKGRGDQWGARDGGQRDGRERSRESRDHRRREPAGP